MSSDQLKPRQALEQGLLAHNIPILEKKVASFVVPKGYEIEFESGFLFKLWWEGEVVAPFSDINELCQFLNMA